MKIYLVTGSRGQYDDRSDWNVAAFKAKKRAEEIRSKLQKLFEYNKSFRQEVETTFHNKYLAEHGTFSELRPYKPEMSDELKELIKIKKIPGTPTATRFKQLNK